MLLRVAYCGICGTDLEEYASDSGWYVELLTDLPIISGGRIKPPPGPGLGTRLLPEVPKRADAVVRSSVLEA